MKKTLENASYLSLATFRKNGDEIKTPVWFAPATGKLYVFSAGDAGKVKRLRNFAKARVAPCDVRGKVLGDWQDAKAHILSSQVDNIAHQALLKKYGWMMKSMDFFADLGGRKSTRAYIEITLL